MKGFSNPGACVHAVSVRFVLLGPPGAGKGSLAQLFDKRLGWRHLSTGEIFRHEIKKGTPLGKRVQRYVAKGRLVPDALVVEVMAHRLTAAAKGRRRGFVLDGFPRTAAQAEGLDAVLSRRGLPLDAAIYVTSPRELLVRRLSGRLVCSRCGMNYHVRTMKPKRLGVCDDCGAALVTRKDDQPRTIRTRLRLDAKQVKPLLAYYQQQRLLIRLNGIGQIDTVYRRSLALFAQRGWLTASHGRAQKP